MTPLPVPEVDHVFFADTLWVTDSAQSVCTCSLHDHNRLTHFLLLIQTSPVMLMSKRRVCLKWWHNIGLFIENHCRCKTALSMNAFILVLLYAVEV